MNKNIYEKDYPNLVITEDTIKDIKNHSRFYMNVPIKVQMGKIYTNEEFQKRSDKILSRELPGGKKSFVLKRVFKPRNK
ncbi:MAG: hypothetical protein IJ565_04715 [Bacilli bacterium]|nr:hypothetical protein [Bacilli bacterium]